MNELALFAGAGVFHLGMMLVIDISIGRRKMDLWTKNTDTAKSANAPSAEIHSSHETKGASSNVAQMPAVAFFRQEKRRAPVLSAAMNSFPLDQNMRRVPAHAERRFVCRAGSSIRWSKLGIVLLSFAAQSLHGVCVTKRTEQRRFSGTRSMNYERTLNCISSKECRGTTTEKKATNGA